MKLNRRKGRILEKNRKFSRLYVLVSFAESQGGAGEKSSRRWENEQPDRTQESQHATAGQTAYGSPISQKPLGKSTIDEKL